MDNVNAEEETILLNYKGFDVVLPKDMLKEKPYVYLQRVGRYYVEIGDAEKGSIIRVDNCIDGLSDRLARLENAYNQLLNNSKNIEDELAKNEDYDEKISVLLEKLKKLDKELGVKKDD
jgi:hypothetical protein